MKRFITYLLEPHISYVTFIVSINPCYSAFPDKILPTKQKKRLGIRRFHRFLDEGLYLLHGRIRIHRPLNGSGPCTDGIGNL
jgi:hypothetical protein